MSTGRRTTDGAGRTELLNHLDHSFKIWERAGPWATRHDQFHGIGKRQTFDATEIGQHD